MGDLETAHHSESSENSLKKKNFLIKFLEKIGRLLKENLCFIYDKIEEISFFRAVFVGIALGFFAFGIMLFVIALWLVR